MKMEMQAVNSPVIKVDARALVTGKPVYTDDLAPKDSLIVKVLRSPHAHALIKAIDVKAASEVDGIACVLTYEDVPDKRFTMAGQTYPEPSPYDRLILDRRMRFVGDAAAVVAGETEEAVDHALRLIKVEYEVLEPVLDFRQAKDHEILVHPEENWKSLCPVGADNKRNLCACGGEEEGDVDSALERCEYVIDRVYHTKANQQAMMETFRAYTYMDTYGRLNVVASTQIPFHVRRILAHALDVPKSMVRVIKPRIGGGFGAKQTVVAEVYPAIVTMKTGRAAKIVYSRYETQIASSPRHEMEIRVRLGADAEGTIKAIDVYTLSNTGAYGEHGPTTVGLSGHKSIPLYRTPEAFRFRYDVVYTNVMSSGAYRGYGATQGIFAVESAVNELAAALHMDPVVLREKNMVKEGDVMPAYYGEKLNSCALDRCMARAKEMIGWDRKYPRVDMGNGKIVEKGADYLGCDAAQLEFDGKRVYQPEGELEISLKDIGNRIMCCNEKMLSAGYTHTSPVSPPPFMVGMAEVEVDTETGEVELIDYAAVVDCGTVINPNLARVQTEGGIAQGIGMALYEDITYTKKGHLIENSFLQYKLPTRIDVGNIRVEFEGSYEPTGPFGAKSIGEIVINTPSPAIAGAVANAVGVQIRELPITAEKVYRGMREQGKE